jgi:hypothetical protein
MAVLPARGVGEIREAGVGSAFSRGDVLVLNASSNLSRAPDTTAIDRVGVALANSTDSILNKVTYAVPGADQIFWASIVPGQIWTVGSIATISYSAASGYHTSTATLSGFPVTVVAGTAETNQSGESRVLVQFIRHDGNILFS